MILLHELSFASLIANTKSEGIHKYKNGKIACYLKGVCSDSTYITTCETEAEAKEVVRRAKIERFIQRVSTIEPDISAGRVWRNKYIVYPDGKIFTLAGRELHGSPDKDGYTHSCVGKKDYRFHRIVAETFIPNPENKPQVNHIDGNKQNNKVSNLEWCTNSENQQHAIKNGLKQVLKGEHVGTSKLTENDIKFIRSHYKPRDRNFSGVALGKRFGVTGSLITCIAKGKTWKHVHVNTPETPSEAE